LLRRGGTRPSWGVLDVERHVPFLGSSDSSRQRASTTSTSDLELTRKVRVRQKEMSRPSLQNMLAVSVFAAEGAGGRGSCRARWPGRRSRRSFGRQETHMIPSGKTLIQAGQSGPLWGVSCARGFGLLIAPASFVFPPNGHSDGRCRQTGQSQDHLTAERDPSRPGMCAQALLLFGLTDRNEEGWG
jgi:hypothetical protein